MVKSTNIQKYKLYLKNIQNNKNILLLIFVFSIITFFSYNHFFNLNIITNPLLVKTFLFLNLGFFLLLKILVLLFLVFSFKMIILLRNMIIKNQNNQINLSLLIKNYFSFYKWSIWIFILTFNLTLLNLIFSLKTIDYLSFNNNFNSIILLNFNKTTIFFIFICVSFILISNIYFLFLNNFNFKLICKYNLLVYKTLLDFKQVKKSYLTNAKKMIKINNINKEQLQEVNRLILVIIMFEHNNYNNVLVFNKRNCIQHYQTLISDILI